LSSASPARSLELICCVARALELIHAFQEAIAIVKDYQREWSPDRLGDGAADEPGTRSACEPGRQGKPRRGRASRDCRESACEISRRPGRIPTGVTWLPLQYPPATKGDVGGRRRGRSDGTSRQHGDDHVDDGAIGQRDVGARQLVRQDRGSGGPFYGAQPLQPTQTRAPTRERLQKIFWPRINDLRRER